MKKFALAIAALSLTAGAAFADNPNVGRSDVVVSGINAGSPVVDQGTTASIAREGRIVVKQQDLGYQNPAAGRFGDAAPRY